MSLARIADEINRCQKCPLWKTRRRAVPGEGPETAKIMLIGQAPGKEENAQGRPFVGRAGRLLNSVLEESGIERKNIFITSVLKCYPPQNRKPKRNEVQSCLPFLLRQINAIKPKKVCLLGDTALKSVLGDYSLCKVHGKAINRKGTAYFPTYHPAAALRSKRIKRLFIIDMRRFANLKY